MMVLCSRLRRSNILTEPSAPQLTKTSTLLAQNRTSKTSLSCAINCVLAVNDGMSHIVHVVSILDVMIKLAETAFQSNDVRGAVCSGDFEFDNRANGVNLEDGMSRPWFEDLVIELPGEEMEVSEGSDHNRR